MKSSDRAKLLFGPYQAPALRRGDRATCHYRDCDVIVTGWAGARISWPRCRPLDVPRSHPSLLVDEELARAIRQESAAAIRYRWGVCSGVVHRWRKAFGVGRTNCPGSQRLIRDASEQGASRLRGVKLPPEQVERRRRTAAELDLGRHLQPGYHGPRWTRAELALLGKLPDEEVAARVGRTPEAVRVKRTRPGTPTACDRRRGQ
jgi:transposase-like protein